MKNIFYVNTRYQLEVALDVLDYEALDDYLFFAPTELRAAFLSLGISFDQVTFLSKANGKFTFFGARRSLSELKLKTSSLNIENFYLWTANDNHFVCQYLMSRKGFRSIFLFEDGLGSYLDPKTIVGFSRIRVHVSNLKKIIFFFPYYSSVQRFGGNVCAGRVYSYHPGSFPSQVECPRKIIPRTSRGVLSSGIDEYSAKVFVGQPLVEHGTLSLEEYCSAVSAIRSKFSKEKFYYKPHPRERPKDINGVTILDNASSIETVLETSKPGVIVFGFYSTALMNAINIGKVSSVVAIKTPSLQKSEECYEVLMNAGCSIWYID